MWSPSPWSEKGMLLATAARMYGAAGMQQYFTQRIGAIFMSSVRVWMPVLDSTSCRGHTAVKQFSVLDRFTTWLVFNSHRRQNTIGLDFWTALYLRLYTQIRSSQAHNLKKISVNNKQIIVYDINMKFFIGRDIVVSRRY